MKDQVLAFLAEQEQYISGEEISKKLGVTRASIWKMIKKLQNEGYIIESSTKKGYKLIERPNVITSIEIKEIVKSQYIGKEIAYYDEVDSTNEKAKELARNGAREGTVILADRQNAGKGRLGRTWISPPKTGIWMSIILKPHILPQYASRLTLLAGLAMCEAITEVTNLKAEIKWPNDIIVNNKKVCGILTEMNAEMEQINHVILGIGVNVNMKEFPEELPYATSLAIEGNQEYGRKEIIKAFIEKFEEYYLEFQKHPSLGQFIEGYEKNCITLNKTVKIIARDGEYIAQAIGITSDGSLRIRTEDGKEEIIFAGEVSVRGLYDYV